MSKWRLILLKRPRTPVSRLGQPKTEADGIGHWSAVNWDRALRARLADRALSTTEIGALLKAGANIQLVDRFIRARWADVQGCEHKKAEFLVIARELSQAAHQAECELVLEPTLNADLL